MQMYNNILCVEANWMIENCIMSFDNYKKLNKRHNIQVVRRACRYTPALVAFESLPDRFKEKVLKLCPDPRGAANIQDFVVEHITEAAVFFDNYKTSDGKYIPKTKRTEYYANACVLEAIAKMINNRAAVRRAIGGRAVKCWDVVIDNLQTVDKSVFPFSLPDNPRSLERKFLRYKSEGYESIIHKNYINNQKNAGKITSEGQESVLMTLIRHRNNMDDAQIMREYNRIAECFGWPKISRYTVANWGDKLDSTVYASKHGANAYNNEKTMQVKRFAPTSPLYYWTMDGWDVELFYKDDKSYYKRLTVTVVLDTYCKYPIGYAIDMHENATVNTLALKNAMRHTMELFGEMYRPKQIQSDHYAMSRMEPIYQAVAEIFTPAQVHNAKSKVIEPWFRYFNKKYCQMQPNWSGFGVTSEKGLQPNAEMLAKFKNHFPTLEECIEKVESFIAQERAELRDKMMERWAEVDKGEFQCMSIEQYLRTFGKTSETQALLRGSGLTLTLEGHKHTFDCFDTRFRDYGYVRWRVIYDEDDYSRAIAVNDDESLQFMIEEKYVQPMALADRKDGDYEEMMRVREFNKKLIAERVERIKVADETVGRLMENKRELTDLQKFVLTDGKGQHKNNRNRLKLKEEAQDAEESDVFTPGEKANDVYSDY